MANDKNGTIVDSLSQSITKFTEDNAKLNIMLGDLFKMLEERNLGVPVFLTRSLKRSSANLDQVKLNASMAVTELEQSQELLETLSLLTSSLELHNVLENVMDSVVSLTGAERAYLMLYNEETGPEIRAARNWEKETISDIDAHFSSSLVNAAIAQGEAIITDNAQADERFGDQKSVVMQQLRSVLCIPLTIRGQLVGILYADNRFQQGVFKRQDLPLLTAFGTQAAIAIKNARDFGVVREGLEEAEREIYRLRIEIDQAKRLRDVQDIVESGTFEELRNRAKKLRERRHQSLNREVKE